MDTTNTSIIDTPVGCGYDYFSSTDYFLDKVKERPILKVTPENLRISNENETSIVVETKESIEELCTSLNVQGNIEGQYKQFSMEAAGSFMTKNKKSSRCAYTHIVAVQRRARHTFVQEVGTSLDPVFLTALNGKKAPVQQDESEEKIEDIMPLDPYDLLSKYGTHVITEAVLGGLFEMFIVTEMNSDETYRDVQGKISAAYSSFINGEVDVNASEARADIENRSNCVGKSIGGKPVSFSDFTEIHKNYKIWVESLEDPNNYAFCGYSGTFDSALIPISQLPTSSVRKDEISKAFETRLNSINNAGTFELTSNLGLEIYRTYDNDMVTALSQYAVNKALVSSWKNGEVAGHLSANSYVYVLETIDWGDADDCEDEEQDFKPVTFFLFPDTDVVNELPEAFEDELHCEDLYEQLNSLHLFEIPKSSRQRTKEQKKIIEKARRQYHVKMALNLEFGIPPFFTRDDINEFRPLKLMIDSTAEFSQSFKTMSALVFKDIDGRIFMSRQSQNDKKKAWFMTNKVDFKISGDGRIKDLDKSVQDNIIDHFQLKKEGMSEVDLMDRVDSMYSVSELSIDISKLSYGSVPQFSAFTFEDNATIHDLLKIFVQKEMGNSLLLSRTVTRSREEDERYYVVPEKYEFSVSQGPVDKTGREDTDLRTLNYVIKLTGDSEGKFGLRPQSYNELWNWLPNGAKHCQSGVTAINRETIFNKFIGDFQNEVLSELRLRVHGCTRGGSLATWRAECSLHKANSRDDKSFVFDKNDKTYYYGGKGYTWEQYGGEVNKILVFFNTCTFEAKYFMSASARWGTHKFPQDEREHPSIIFEVSPRVWMRAGANGGYHKGDVYDHKLTCYIGLNIDDYGNITVIKDLIDQRQSEGLEESTWGQFASFGRVDLVADSISATIRKHVEGAINKFRTRFNNNFQLNSGWIIPGKGTFTFSDERFSTNGDFAVNVNYYIGD